VGWGDKTDQQLAFTGIDAVTIAAGGFQSLLAQADGSILVSQAPSNSVIVADSNGYPVVALAAGYAHGLAIRRDGTSFAFGNNDHGQTVIPPVALTSWASPPERIIVWAFDPMDG